MASALIDWFGDFPATEVGIALARTTISVVTFTYNVTTNYVVPGVKAVGSTTINTVTRIVKGRPQVISAEAFDLTFQENGDDDFVCVNNGTELNPLKRSASVPF